MSSTIKKILLIIAGWLSVILAIIGIVLPLLPTTPFLLLAAFCFSKSSERFHDWLLNHRWFGDYIRNFQSGRGMTFKAKVSTIFLIWLSIGASVTFFVPIWWVKVMLLLIAALVSIYLASRPTYHP